MRLVFDTNVVVAAFRSPAGASAQLVRLAREGRVHLAASGVILQRLEKR